MTRDESKLFDVRVVERNLRRGTIPRKDYERYLKALPDVSANAAASRPDESPPERRESYRAPRPERVIESPASAAEADLDDDAEDDLDDEAEDEAEDEDELA